MTALRRNKLITNIVLFILVFCLVSKFAVYAAVILSFFATIKFLTR